MTNTQTGTLERPRGRERLFHALALEQAGRSNAPEPGGNAIAAMPTPVSSLASARAGAFVKKLAARSWRHPIYAPDLLVETGLLDTKRARAQASAAKARRDDKFFRAIRPG